MADTSVSALITPRVSIFQAACRVSRRAWSMATRHSAMRSRLPPRSIRGLRKAVRAKPRWIANSSDFSAAPMQRMQWWMRPGPRRPWAISKPRPGPEMKLPMGTRTLWKCTSPWPWGSSYSPNTGSMRWISTPGVSMGTSTMECWWWRSLLSSGVRAMKMPILQRGSPTPDDHHFLPFRTMWSPSITAVAAMLVASDEATSGSVMKKTERISPASRGLSHRSFCSALPYFQITSMLPESGALQLKISGAIIERPVCSALKA